MCSFAEKRSALWLVFASWEWHKFLPCALRSREKLSLAFLFGFHPISYSTFLTVAPPRPSKITDVFELYLSIVTCTNGPLVLLFAEIALPFG